MLNLIDTVGRYVSIPAALGLLLLLPLYLSQHRDLIRLRLWMDREPGHPPVDLATSEAILDRAEAELESLLVATGQAPAVSAPVPAGPPTEVAPPPQAPPGTPASGLTPLPPAQRVTSERPALERITMERAALEPHPRWRRFGARITRPRTLIVIALAALTLGGAALIASGAILDTGSSHGTHPHRPGAVVPSHVNVAVLNGTSVPGLAAQVSETMRENNFKQGPVGATRKQYQQTVVMYGGGDKKAAERVAHVLGVTPIQRIDKTTRAIAGNADVVVIAGADRTRH